MSQQMHFQQVPQGPAPTHGLPVARNGMGVTALVLGIIGVLSGIPMITFWLAGPLGVLALIFGLVGRGRVKKGQATNKGVAITGTVLGVIAILVSITGLILTLWVFNEAKNEIEEQTGNNVTGVLGADAPAEYNNGIEVAVSKPSVYTVDPATLVDGHTEGNKAYMVTITVKNNGDDVFDPVLMNTEARVDGKEVSEVNDDKHGLLHHLDGSIAPGASSSVEMVFDVPPAASGLDVTVTPDLLLDPATWNLKL